MNGILIGNKDLTRGFFPFVRAGWDWTQNPLAVQCGPSHPIPINREKQVKWYYRVNRWRHTLEFNLQFYAVNAGESAEPPGWWYFRTQSSGPISFINQMTDRITPAPNVDFPDLPGSSVTSESDLVYPARIYQAGELNAGSISGDLETQDGSIIDLEPDNPSDPPLGSTPGGSLIFTMWGENPVVDSSPSLEGRVATAIFLSLLTGNSAMRDDSPLSAGVGRAFYISTVPPTDAYMALVEAESNGGSAVDVVTFRDAWTIDGETGDVHVWGIYNTEEASSMGLTGTVSLTSEIGWTPGDPAAYNSWGGTRNTATGALL